MPRAPRRRLRLARGIEFSSYGSWTLKSAPKEAGVEPGDCFIVGNDQGKDVPDLAIEVIWTSGGIDKLEIYRRLGVGEIWLWQDGRLGVHLLQRDRYERAARSRRFPDLDLPWLCTLLDRPTTSQAIQALRDGLRS